MMMLPKKEMADLEVQPDNKRKVRFAEFIFYNELSGVPIGAPFCVCQKTIHIMLAFLLGDGFIIY